MSAPDVSRGAGERRSGADWREWAQCGDVDPDLFFPTTESGPVHDRQVAAAKAVCARCPVRAQCLAEALARVPYGIAGGLTEDERRVLTHRSGRSRQAELPVAAEEVARVGTHSEVAAVGRVLLGGGRSPGEVARRCGVSERTAQRWAGTCRSVRAAGGCGMNVLVSLRALAGWGLVCSCECMTCALGQHCGWCRSNNCRAGGRGFGRGWRS